MTRQLILTVKNIIQNNILDNHYVIFISRCILAATFFASSAGKFVDIERYSVAMVYNFDILPGPLAIAFGWALPFIEFACALSFLFGVLTRLSAIGGAIMGGSFFAIKAVLLSQGIDIECGCFGALMSTMASWSIYLDPMLFLLSAGVLFSSPHSRHWISLWNKLPDKWRSRLDLIW